MLNGTTDDNATKRPSVRRCPRENGRSLCRSSFNLWTKQRLWHFTDKHKQPAVHSMLKKNPHIRRTKAWRLFSLRVKRKRLHQISTKIQTFTVTGRGRPPGASGWRLYKHVELKKHNRRSSGKTSAAGTGRCYYVDTDLDLTPQYQLNIWANICWFVRKTWWQDWLVWCTWRKWFQLQMEHEPSLLPPYLIAFYLISNLRIRKAKCL